MAFNSAFNRDIFLSSINTHINKSPDFKARGLADEIRPKTVVLYFPVFPSLHPAFPVPSSTPRHVAPAHGPESEVVPRAVSTERPINIVWPHRWEFDKNPDDFFSVLFNLAEDNVPFTVSIMVRHVYVLQCGVWVLMAPG